MNRFFHATALMKPESVKPFLARPTHWKKGRSAFELASSWIPCQDIPPKVRTVLDECAPFRGAVLLEGFFEHETDLRSAGGPTHTDLLAVLRVASGLGVIAVEGKAGEDFGPTVQKWNDRAGTERRLATLCEYFGLQAQSCLPLRYQLLHRTAAAMFEAERYQSGQAMMLVHSFAESEGSFNDYAAFAQILGLSRTERNRATEPRSFHGIELRLAWVDDTLSA